MSAPKPQQPQAVDEPEEVCGETYEHDLREVGEGYWICRRCDAEVFAEGGPDAEPESGSPEAVEQATGLLHPSVSDGRGEICDSNNWLVATIQPQGTEAETFIIAKAMAAARELADALEALSGVVGRLHPSVLAALPPSQHSAVLRALEASSTALRKAGRS